MARAKLYFYITTLLIIASFYFNTLNPLINVHFQSSIKMIVVTSIANLIVLFAAIIFADKSIKHAAEKTDWIRRASKMMPYILLLVLIIHIVSSLFKFGIIG